MDFVHRAVIVGTILATKPRSVLELGYGSGELTRQIYGALQYNGQGLLTVVDNWHDWQGNRPSHAPVGIEGLQLIETDEILFMSQDRQWDTIIADAEHATILSRLPEYVKRLHIGGHLFCHDCSHVGIINPDRESLYCVSTRPDERCGRGLWHYRS